MPTTKVINVTGKEARNIIEKEKKLLIIDVRTLEEYRGGHIKRARLYPVEVLPLKILELQKYKNDPLLVYCASGGRSPSAVRIFINYGFTRIYHMSQGISSWPYALEKI